MEERIIIVEGKTDKQRLLQVLAEPVSIYCTNGSYSAEKAQQLAEKIEQAAETFVFTDEDYSGKKLRAQLEEDFPYVTHLYTKKIFTQVANTPLDVLAEILERAGFAVQTDKWNQG
ncbi:toprim domain-containing protein [Brevibacillus sp. H7]|uniref:toprim domain-containing protein n=1 Tax=Brevibacillus sp. H7 TaxID=3349138 RepID=UPI0038121297